MLRPATANRTSIDLVRPLAPRNNGSIGPLGTKPWNSAMRCSWQDCGIASVLRATYRPLTANGTSNIKLTSGTKTVPPKLLLQALGDIYDCVEALGVSPVLAGGLAVSFWGHPRSTQDIDLAILVENKKHFEDELTRLGLKAKKPGRWIDLGVVQVSQWTLSLENQYIDCKIDFLTSDSAFHREAIAHAPSAEFTGVDRELKVLSLEDLLLFKAASGRMIDLADIRTLCEIHHEALDVDYLASKSQELKLPPEFWKG